MLDRAALSDMMELTKQVSSTYFVIILVRVWKIARGKRKETGEGE